MEGPIPVGGSIFFDQRTRRFSPCLCLDICRKLFDPTFWAARTFAYITDKESSAGFTTFLGGPASVSLRSNGTLEWIALRNAPKERAFLFLPLPVHPIAGTDPEEHTFHYAVWFSVAGQFPNHRPPFIVRNVLGRSWLTREHSPLDRLADGLVTTGHEDVLVRAIKQADYGRGIIVRLASYLPRGSTVELRCPFYDIKTAFLCTAREWDIEELQVEKGAVCVPLRSATISVRLLPPSP